MRSCYLKRTDHRPIWQRDPAVRRRPGQHAAVIRGIVDDQREVARLGRRQHGDQHFDRVVQAVRGEAVGVLESVDRGRLRRDRHPRIAVLIEQRQTSAGRHFDGGDLDRAGARLFAGGL